MGAFFISHVKAVIDDSAVEALYQKKGFKAPLSIRIGDFNLKLFRKQLLDVPNYFHENNNYVFACGSLFYKGTSYTDSLKLLLSDFQNNTIERDKLYGNYVIIFYTGTTREIVLGTDPSYIKNIYFNKEQKIISTDFLAILESADNNYTLNKLAIIENLTTGHLIGPDTYANEIQKVDRINIETIQADFQGITVYDFKPRLKLNIENYNDAIAHANSGISKYFEAAAAISDEYGAHIGLTGGFDSRLLLMHARKYLKNLITNSFWRPDSIEFSNARELARVAGLTFNSFEHTKFIVPKKEEMIKRSFYFFDGQVRSQNKWDQEFNLSEYSSKIADKHFVGFHGCGGEQYRNADRLMLRLPVHTYIRHEWMFKQCSNVFIDKRLESEIADNIEKKIRRIAGITGRRIGLTELKKIQNEVWNAANRATRVNVLNQQQFYFAPFTEYQLAQTAYSYVPFLGNSLSFQIEMLNACDRELTSVSSNYRFNLLKGETFKYRLIPYIFNACPKSLFYFFYHKRKNLQKNKFQDESFTTQRHSFFVAIENKINTDKLSKNINLGNSLSSFDFILKNLNVRIDK